MPLYIYTCATCELEMEELFPMNKAPEKIRCPLCGGYFLRDVALFGFTLHGAATTVDIRDLSTTGRGDEGSRHGFDCACCSPRQQKSGRFRPGHRFTG